MWKLSALALALALGFSPAYAEEMPRALSAEEQQMQQSPTCAPLDAVTKILADKYREVPAATMLSENGEMIAIFATPDGASFTLAIVQPDGMTCIAAAGSTFAVAATQKPGWGV